MTSECQNCGEIVTDDFHRVFCDDDGNLRKCPSCANMHGNLYGEKNDDLGGTAPDSVDSPPENNQNL